jgi:methionyl-tRNA formyltransferase
MDMDVVFLGVNDIGMRIYQWLCRRDGVCVNALLTEQQQLDLIETIQPKLIISVGFDYLVPPEILDVPERGAINLHPSLLPHNRGKSPNVWPIVEETPAGVTLHYMDEEFDTGEIIAQREVEFDFSDTGKDLHTRLENEQYDLFTDVWPKIEQNDINPSKQETDKGRYHSKEDFIELCEFDPEEKLEAKELLNRLRALTFPPFDNAHIEIDGETYYIDVDIRRAEETRKEVEGLLSAY